MSMRGYDYVRNRARVGDSCDYYIRRDYAARVALALSTRHKAWR